MLVNLLIDPREAAYVVVDTEGTGLDPEYDVILEVGVAIYDRWLNQLAVNSWYVKDQDWEIKLSGAHDMVRAMHNKSGLIADLHGLPDRYTFRHHRLGNQNGNYDPAFVSLSIWEWLTELCGLEAGKFPMTGSSIGSYDRPFWRKHLPVAEGFFGYRNVDVSSVKEICKIANPGLYAEMAARPEFQKDNSAHRVRDDMAASMRELEFYYHEFLNVNIPEIVRGQDPLPGLADV